MALAFVSLMFGTLLRSTILAVLCGLLLWIFRVKAAEMRHLLWRIVLLALFVLAALQFTASSLPYAGILNGARQRAATPLPSPQSGENAVLQAMIGLYLFVTYCFLTRLTIGLFRLKRIADQTEFVAVYVCTVWHTMLGSRTEHNSNRASGFPIRSRFQSRSIWTML